MNTPLELVKHIFCGYPRLCYLVDIGEVDRGFYCRWMQEERGFRYIIEVPKGIDHLNIFTRLTMLHECGHVVFHEMFYSDRSWLKNKLDEVLNKKWMCRILRCWHWNKLLRLIKEALGFSRKLTYKREDSYWIDGQIFTYEDCELFCDWFAIEGWKEWVQFS